MRQGKQLPGIPVLAIAGLALLSSCGAVSGSSATNDLSEAEKTRIAEEYRDCMAEGGLDGQISFEGGGINIDVSGGDDNMTEEEMIAIEMTCEEQLEALDSGFELDPEEEAQLADAAPKIQACLAEKGYEVAITVDDGGLSFNSSEESEGFDEAEYVLAEEDCLREAVPELWEKYSEDD